MRESISVATARRIALAAQGFAEQRPTGLVDRRHLKRTLARLGLFQIDSVSAVVRAHYMPLFSRLGPYPMTLLDEASGKRKRLLFEYWAHEASLLPLETQPLMRWRMARAEQSDGIYGGLSRFGRERKTYIDEVLAGIMSRGPTVASDLEGPRGPGGWWGWSDAKTALEWLFWAGRITTSERRGFERVYDIPDRVLPDHILSIPTPTPADAHRDLLRIASRALGIGTVSDLRDYFRQSPDDVRERIGELVETGEIVPVQVEGWIQLAYVHAEARWPRKVEARALLAPFDPLVWERARTERMFGFRYRIEIYTPAEKRVHGYYVLPFLLGEMLVARVDLRADRKAGVLRVIATYAEPHAPAHTAEALHAELLTMQAWLGLERMEIMPAGDLGPALVRVGDAAKL